MSKLILRLRECLYLREDQVSDEGILKLSEGTSYRASIECNIAFEELVNTTKETVSKDLNVIVAFMLGYSVAIITIVLQGI